MMKRLIATLIVCFAAAPAAAQTDAQDWRAAHALSAMWRPVASDQPLTPAALETACAGALQEMAAIEAAMPPVISPQSLAPVKAIRGLLIVPGNEDDPASAFFFPSRDLTWFASGLGAVASLSEADGLIGVRDAAGANISFQIGRASDRPILRTRPPGGGPMLTFVGCASTAG
jgi:hypothetical protein